MTTNKSSKGLPTWLLVILPIIVVAGAFAYLRFFTPSVLADFAKCLTEKKAVFFGAFDCPHCLAQKADFGRSMQYIKYVECKLPNGGWSDECKKENITSTPTWKFDGKDPVSGRQSLQVLADKTSCPLPEGVVQKGTVAKPAASGDTSAETTVTIPTETPVAAQ